MPLAQQFKEIYALKTTAELFPQRQLAVIASQIRCMPTRRTSAAQESQRKLENNKANGVQ
jgi:hypothetical protein